MKEISGARRAAPFVMACALSLFSVAGCAPPDHCMPFYEGCICNHWGRQTDQACTPAVVSGPAVCCAIGDWPADQNSHCYCRNGSGCQDGERRVAACVGSGGTPPAAADGGATPTPCETSVFQYQSNLAGCFTNIQPPTTATVTAACGRPDSAWPGCLTQLNAFTACKTGRSCADWIIGCWSEFRALDACLGQPDPGATPPSNPATAGFQGASTTCDPSMCRGETIDCDFGPCITCTHHCSGIECATDCNI